MKNNNLITFLSLVRIDTEDKLNQYISIVERYYEPITKPYPNYFIKMKSKSMNIGKTIQALDDRNIDCFISLKKDNYLSAFVYLIKNVKAKYFMFIVDDILPLFNDDFLTPSIDAMEKDNRIIEVFHGGGFLNGGTSNLDNIVIRDNKLYFKDTMESDSFEPLILENDTVWTLDLKPNNMLFYPFPYYNVVMRTDIVKKINDIIEPQLQNTDLTWDSYLKYVNGGISSSTIKTTGYPKGLDFLSNYKCGFLNMCCYTYYLNHTNGQHESIDSFKTTHTKKIKSIDDIRRYYEPNRNR